MKGVLLPCGHKRLFSGTAELATGTVRYERVKGAVEAVREMCRGTGEPCNVQNTYRFLFISVSICFIMSRQDSSSGSTDSLSYKNKFS